MSNRYINPSGFAENLPAAQLVEDELKSKFQTIATSYGYTHLETASVEYLDTLASKGDVNKEIFTIGRALGEGEGEEAERGLHFDLTVPFARYVAQNQGSLSFPYRRYQVQKVWRGERPQKGRFREFYQADVDVVARENLPLAFDAEVALVMGRVLDSFGIGKITVRINNRQFLNGLFAALGIEARDEVLQIIDKLDKVGEAEVRRVLAEDLTVSAEAIDGLFAVIKDTVAADQVATFLAGVAGDNETLEIGKAELQQVFTILAAADDLKQVTFVFDPRIARGLDYYTGTVYETTIDGYEQYGSICSGGRYADLAGRFTNQKLPGVGMSIGLTRLLSVLQSESLLDFSRQSASDVVVCLLDEAQLVASLQTAEQLRFSGLNVEMNYRFKDGLGKQLGQVEEKDVPYALVCEADGKFTLFTTKQADGKQVFTDLEELIDALVRE